MKCRWCGKDMRVIHDYDADWYECIECGTLRYEGIDEGVPWEEWHYPNGQDEIL